tara:strand:+ start:777 stop:1355 length:579 start_codon:yes stop_codon:yes gene_type:complete
MYVTVIIFSHWTLAKIFEFLTDYLEADQTDILLANIEKNGDKEPKEPKETNRTLILVKKSLLDKYQQEDHLNVDFRMEEFRLSSKHYPAKNQTDNFYIQIPQVLSSVDAEILVQEKMKVFVYCGLISAEEYMIRIPLVSRITGGHRGFMLLDFNEEVDIKTRALIKALIQNSFFYSDLEKIHYLPVFWSLKK